MSFLAQRLASVRSSPSSMAGQKVRELRAQGRDIVGLTLGEPDFATPAYIVEAAIQAMKDGHTRYTDVGGTVALRTAICRKLARDNGLQYAPEQIIVGTGGKQVIFNALMATLDPGDEVIVPAPYWVSYPDITRLAGAVAVEVPCDDRSHFKLSADALEAAITPRTKWLVLNSPANPSGAVYTDAELGALAEVLLRHPQVWVLCDDIYEHIRYTAHKPASLPALAPALQDRCLIVNGVSKAYAMTGWRIGYGAAPVELIRAMVKLQSQSTTNPNAVAQQATLAALDGDQDCVAGFVAHFRERRALMLAALDGIPGLTVVPPDGAFYVFPSVQGLLSDHADGRPRNTLEFADYLLDTVGLAVLPGEAFGLPGYIRLSYAAATATLTEGCARLRTACLALSQRGAPPKETA